MVRFCGPADQVVTVQGFGLAGMMDGAILAHFEGSQDVFVTADRNPRYQQNLKGRSLAIVELPTNRLPVLKTIADEIESAVRLATPGSYVQVSMPTAPGNNDPVA